MLTRDDTVKRQKKPRRNGAGYSIPAAAEAIGVSYKTMRNAIALKQVRTVNFGGLERVPPAEIARLKKEFA